MPRFYVNPSPTFERAAKLISAITNASPATVTTTTNHNYADGDIVRLIIPKIYGMTRAHNLQGEIDVTGATTFTIDIDTSALNPFAIPSPLPWYVNASAQVVPIGEITCNLDGATHNNL